MKSKLPRLDNERLADALVERGLVERDTAQAVLQQAEAGGQPFPELLVAEGHAGDWEVSRVAAEVFHLPFLTVEIAAPDASASEGLDPSYLRRHGLVPLHRFGDLLTVAMPAMVPTAVLTGLAMDEQTVLLPVVGTVATNRSWLEAHLPEAPAPDVDDLAGALPAPLEASGDDWADVFDAGDEAVQIELRQREERGEEPELP